MVKDREDFVIKIPNITQSGAGRDLLTVVMALAISALLLTGSMKLFQIRGVLVLLTLSILVYVIISSMSGTGEELSLPPTTYPLPPHLGHDGVSLEVQNS